MVRPRDPYAPPRKPARTRYPAPAPERLAGHRGTERRISLPWPARIVLVLALLALGGAVALAGTGLLNQAVRNLGATLASIFEGQLATPSPSPTPLVAPDAPTLIEPADSYTNQPSWTVRGFVPATLDRRQDLDVRVYVAGEVAAEQPLGATQDFIVTVPIPLGRSEIFATIVGPGGEGSRSNTISVAFDNTPPTLKITTPRNGATVNAASVTVKGTTQSGATVSIRNENNQAVASAVAVGDDFEIEIALGAGSNGLTITSVDPAGNIRSLVLTVIRGGGKLAANLTVSPTSFDKKNLPRAIIMSVVVLDPDGRRLDGARVTFTLQIPNVGPVVLDAVTENGVATRNTAIPASAHRGNGLVTARIVTDRYGTVTDTAAFRIY